MNKPGDGLTAPIIAARDDGPLSPAKLAERELTAGQAIRAMDALDHIARSPRNDPSYPAIHARLREAEADCFEAIDVAYREYETAAEVRALTATLDMTSPENVHAYAEAMREADAARAVGSNLWRLLVAIRSRMMPKGA